MLRASLERIDSSTVMLTVHKETDGVWWVVEMVRARNAATCVALCNTIAGETVHALEADGTWSEPDAITLAEALECTI